MPNAVTIIHDEHRAFAAVLHGLLSVVEQVRSRGEAADFRLLHAMLDYIEAFPEKLHHPKEDEYVYRLLRRRAPQAAPILDELADEHRRGGELLARLGTTLRAFEGDAAAFEPFAAAVAAYADFHWAHMRKEEDEVLPLAERVLLPADWQAIDAAFGSNADPLVGIDSQREMRELFRRLTHLAPAPIGVGPPAPAGR
jgi:hemerythrin-like domain-containing protein